MGRYAQSAVSPSLSRARTWDSVASDHSSPVLAAASASSGTTNRSVPVVIGAHSPEFPCERDVDQVRSVLLAMYVFTFG